MSNDLRELRRKEGVLTRRIEELTRQRDGATKELPTHGSIFFDDWRSKTKRDRVELLKTKKRIDSMISDARKNGWFYA